MPWQELTTRVGLCAALAAAVLLNASVWVSAPLGLATIAATAELAVRPYATNAIDRLLLGSGSAVAGLILTGLVLNLTPWGLSRPTWLLSVTAVSVMVLIWRRKGGGSRRPRHGLTRPSALWATSAAVVIALAGIVAQVGARDWSARPLLAFSLVSKSARSIVVEINATSISGTYRITANSTAPGARGYQSGVLSISSGASGASVRERVPVNVASRWTVTLSSLSSAQERTLVVDVGSRGGGHWATIWMDNFSGPAGKGVSSHYWKYGLGHGVFGGVEVETMTKSVRNVSTDGRGDLNITALRNGGVWTSGRIQTRGKGFAVRPGQALKVSASIRQPNPANGLGYWPAFWMLARGQRNTSGEIDILESPNAKEQHSGTYHCGHLRKSSIACRNPAGVGSGPLPCPNCQVRYHTYSVVIDRLIPGHGIIRWYLDGKDFFDVTEAQIGAAAWKQSLDSGFSILINLAIGGGYPNYHCQCKTPTQGTSSGGTMSIAYVNVSKWAA